jgi:hypothetical protein
MKRSIREEKDPLIKGLKIQSRLFQKNWRISESLLKGAKERLARVQRVCTELYKEKWELKNELDLRVDYAKQYRESLLEILKLKNEFMVKNRTNQGYSI